MGAGRPSKYSEEMLNKAFKYLEVYKSKGQVIPSAAGLALYIGVSKKTLYNWGDENPEFLHMLSTMNETQEMNLLSGGLSGDYNAAIAKLILAKHNYSDKQETDITSGGEKLNLGVTFVDTKKD